MAQKRLNIISNNQNSSSSSNETFISSRLSRKKEMQAKFERLWLIDPEQFNPLRDSMQRERLERSWTLLAQHTNLQGKYIVDLGCGSGVFSRRMRDAGAKIEAVDIAENALKHLKEHEMQHIQAKQDGMPTTSLPDQAYDVVVCMEVIAWLHRDDCRLFFAELSRLVKSNGYIICSTPIDIYSEGAVHRLLEMAQTELNIIDSLASYHAFYLRLKAFVEAPNKFVHAWEDRAFCQRELAERQGFDYVWFWINSTFIFIWFWLILSTLSKPLLSLLKNNHWLLLRLEKLCQFFWDETGINHFIFIAQRRPVTMKDEVPIERPHKKEIWE